MLQRRDFALSLILGLRSVLFCVICSAALLPRLEIKENTHCHPAFIMRDIIICRESYTKGRLKFRVRESYHFCNSYNTQISFKAYNKTFFDDSKRYNLYHHT